MDNLKLESIPIFADSKWSVWVGASAIRGQRPPQNHKVLGEVAGYLLIDADQQPDVRDFSPEAPLVVYDSRLSSAGVVTGVIRIILKEGANSEFLGAIPNIKIRDAFPEIKTYFITSTEVPFDLQKLLEQMRTDVSVQDAQLEILSQNYDKN